MFEVELVCDGVVVCEVTSFGFLALEEVDAEDPAAATASDISCRSLRLAAGTHVLFT